jgi:transposase InsO family protein
MKKPGRPRGTTIPAPFAREIKRVRQANPRVGSRRIKFLLQAPVHHSTVHRFLRSLGLVQERPYKRRVWKRFRAEYPNKRWQIDITETLLHGRILYKITVVDDHSNTRLVSHLSWDATGATIARILEEAILLYGPQRSCFLITAPSSGAVRAVSPWRWVASVGVTGSGRSFPPQTIPRLLVRWSTPTGMIRWSSSPWRSSTP